MADSNFHFGSGDINSHSNVFNIGAEEIDYTRLTSQLQTLLTASLSNEKITKQQVADISGAVSDAKQGNKAATMKALKALGGYVIDFARELSLEYLVRLTLGK